MSMITDAIREQFSFTDCWRLAKACHDLTAWPMVAVGYLPEGSIDGAIGWAHLAVRVPDGRCLDVNGLHDEGDLIDMYEPYLTDDPQFPRDGIEELIEVSLDQFRKVLSVDPPEVGDDILGLARSLISTYELDSLLQ